MGKCERGLGFDGDTLRLKFKKGGHENIGGWKNHPKLRGRLIRKKLHRKFYFLESRNFTSRLIGH